MTNFAATIITQLKTASATDRAAFARRCVGEFDRNADGQISAPEFHRVFATLHRTEQLTGGATTSFVSTGCRPTLFEDMLFPSYSNAYAVSAYQATAMLGAFDSDDDNALSLDELMGNQALPPDDATAPEEPPPPTPAERADELLAAYDMTDKGYITIDDIVSKWLADPALGNIADAGNAIEAWDNDGDGKVTRDDIIAAYQAMDAADAVMNGLADTKTGLIDLAHLPSETLATLDLTHDQLSAWDADSSGTLSRNEVIDGMKIMQAKAAKDAEAAAFAALVTRYDSNGSGAIDPSELQSALGTVTLDPESLAANFAAWDVNADRTIDAAELQKGYAAIKDAQSIIAAYDLAGKGYFDAADLQRVIDENGSAEGQASASDILAAWDRDGDGRVSLQDVLTMKLAMAAAASAATPPDAA